LSKLSVITNSQYKKSTDGKNTNVSKNVTYVIHIRRKLCHYSHFAAGEYTREASRRNFFSEVCLLS